MRKTVFLTGLTIGFFVIPFLIHAEVYQWIDDKGTIHFTDDYSNIPSSDRERFKVEIREDNQEGKPSSEPQRIIVGSKRERGRTDPSRQEEEWWEGRARPWERQREEAIENYELADKEFMEESSKLILRKFGSHQQFKSTIISLDSIKEERSKYEAQIIEAEGRLEKILREVEKRRAEQDRFIGVLSPYQGDLDGSHEAWWRQRLFTVREKLEEAIEDYKKSYEAYSKNVEKLGVYRFGGLSLTQYQWNSCRLEMLNNEMGKNRAQMRQAQEMLDQLLKEAEESKANPDWLK